MKARYRTTIEGEVKSHRVLWVTAKTLSRRANARKKGSFYFDLSAMILCYAVVEAYANFILQVVDPELYKRERQHFRHAGTAGKIKWIMQQAKISVDTRRRPHTTIRALHDLRNLAMHAKPDTYHRQKLHARIISRPMILPGQIERRVTRDKRKRALKDIEMFCELVHGKLLLKTLTHEQKRRLEPYALSGSTHLQTASTTLYPDHSL